MKYYLIGIAAIVYLIAISYTFNHISVWVGWGLLLAGGAIALKFILKYINNQK